VVERTVGIMNPLGLHARAAAQFVRTATQFSSRVTVSRDGTTIDGPAGLRGAILRHKDAFLLSFTRSLMTYALGRRVEAADMPTVRRIIRSAEAQDYRLSAFIAGVIESSAFQRVRRPAPETTTDVQH